MPLSFTLRSKAYRLDSRLVLSRDTFFFLFSEDVCKKKKNRRKHRCLLWRVEPAQPFISLPLSPHTPSRPLVIVAEGAVLLNNLPHLHILLPVHLICYAGAKRLY